MDLQAPRRLRSLLFVPGDRPDRMNKALASGADALVLDLEDAVSADKKAEARRAIAQFLRQQGREVALFVRINALESDLVDHDLDAIVPANPTGIVVPKVDGAKALVELEKKLIARDNTSVPMLPITAETPSSLFHLGEIAGSSRRIVAMTWGAEDLSTSLGAYTARDASGGLSSPLEVARAMTLFAATSANVSPIETVFATTNDLDGLARCAKRASRDGFHGMLAIHPAQIPSINSAFTPCEQELTVAREIVRHFDENPGAGALALNGRLVDRPHLQWALGILARFNV